MASYYQDKNNRKWSVRFRVIEDGKEVYKRLRGFKTKKEATASYNNFMASYVAPIKEKGEPFDITFNELFNAYIKHNQGRIKESSLYDIKKNYFKHIAPFIADKKLIKITKNDILNFYKYLNEKEYAYKTKTKLRGYISTILNYAVKYYDLPTNIVLKIDNFRNTEYKQEMQIWSYEEYKRFIDVIENDLFKCLFMLLYLTGCRKGEALALTWKDIDFTKNTININKSLTRKCEGTTFLITTPKNVSSVRKIKIPQILSDELQKLKSISNGNLIFANDNIPIAENTITRNFKKYCELAGVEKIRIHDLRHSHASFLINQGESIVLIAKRLGHSDIEQTLNTYSHLMPNEENQMILRLDAIL